ncbi:hypothetical protein MSKU3_2454 [Komagataeibacter oboediens]|nr:hypothetical protein MSKU3_2454 [Komagataeibacter oboediens]
MPRPAGGHNRTEFDRMAGGVPGTRQATTPPHAG